MWSKLIKFYAKICLYKTLWTLQKMFYFYLIFEIEFGSLQPLKKVWNFVIYVL